MRRVGVPTALILGAALLALAGAGAPPAHAQVAAPTPRRLTELDFQIIGARLEVAPPALTVPKDIATFVTARVVLPAGAASDPAIAEAAAELARGAAVLAELRGPDLEATTITARPGEPLQLPPFRVVGDYFLDDIRLVKDGEVLLAGTPSVVPIKVIADILISSVTTRPLSLREIQERGISVDESSFHVLEFQAAFVIEGQRVSIQFPVVFPDPPPQGLRGAAQAASFALSEGIARAQQERTVIELPPELDRPGFNLFLVGAEFVPVEATDPQVRLLIPPIPALILIPGNIGFLNQFFSAIVMVENGAPGGANLVVRDVRAEIQLPLGLDRQGGTVDDPLRVARTAAGVQATVPVVRAGVDGIRGTTDDVLFLRPGEGGEGEHLIEGLLEGIHEFDIALTATLEGLPSGPVALKGSAKGIVEVRNPTFSLSLTQPRTVRTGEEYDLFATVTNTSDQTANLVRVHLDPRAVSGAELIVTGPRATPDTQVFDTLASGQSATARFRLRSQRTGQVTFTRITSAPGLSASFDLVTGVDERGVPLSPNAIILPSQVDKLPDALVDASQRVLGQALSIATAPRLPPGVRHVPKRIVFEHARELAEPAQRRIFGEAPLRSYADLLFDWFGRSTPDAGFDQLLRETEAGQAWTDALGAALRADVLQGTPPTPPTAPLDLQRDLAEALVYRPAHLSALVAASPVRVQITDASGRRTGSSLADATARREVPFSHTVTLEEQGGPSAGSGPALATELAVVARLDAPRYTVEVFGVAAGLTDLGIVVPGPGGAGGDLVHARYEDLPTQAGSRFALAVDLEGPRPGSLLLSVDADGDGTFESTRAPTATTSLVDGPPQVIAARTLSEVAATFDGPAGDLKLGLVVDVLFSKQVTAASAADALHYDVAEIGVAAAILQPTRRIATLRLLEPIGALVQPLRTLTVTGIEDDRGRVSASTIVPIRDLLADGAKLTGQLRRSDGRPVPNTEVLVFAVVPIPISPGQDGVILGVVPTDANGYYELDFVRQEVHQFSVSAIDPTTGELARVVSRVRHPGGTEIVHLTFVGRGRIVGRVLLEDGLTPAGTCTVNVFPALAAPGSGVPGGGGVFTGDEATFAFDDQPVGGFTIRVQQVEERIESNGSLRRIATGRYGVATGVLRESGGTAEVTVVLTQDPDPRTGGLRGQVFLSDGRTPAVGFPVFIGTFDTRPSPPIVSAVARTDTDATGSFEVLDLQPFSYDAVAIDQATMQFAVGKAVVRPDEVAGVNVIFGSLGAVTGIVRNASGALVAGAIVSGGFELVTTDANGRFLIPELPIGRQTIAAGDPVTSRIGSAPVDVFPGQTTEVAVTLNAAADIRGRVRDSQGQPVAAVFVRIPLPGGYVRVKADQDGFYTFPNMALGSYLVSAPAPPSLLSPDQVATKLTSDFGSAVQSGSVDAIRAAFKQAVEVFVGTSNLLFQNPPDVTPGNFGFTTVQSFQDGVAAIAPDIVFIPTGRLAGRTEDGNGLPTRARVEVLGLTLDDFGAPKVERVALFDSDTVTGAFGPILVAHGTYLVHAARPFNNVILSASGILSPTNPNDEDLVLRFPPTGTTDGTSRGIVLEPDGVTPVGENVEVATGFSTLTVRTAPDGTFVSPTPVPAGAYTFTATDLLTQRRGTRSVIVPAGGEAFVPLRLLGRTSAEILVVRPDGVPVPGAAVEIQSNIASGTTDASGKVAFANVSEGFYSVEAREGAFLIGRAQLEVSQADALAGRTAGATVVLRGFGTVRGTFLREDGVTPIPSAQVTLTVDRARVGAPTTTDADGRFEYIRVPVGTQTVRAVDPATRRAGEATVRLVNQDDLADVAIVTVGLGRVEGRVLSASGLVPVQGALVDLRSAAALQALGDDFPLIPSGVDGSFVFEAVPEGPFTVLAIDRDTLTASAPVTGVISGEGATATVEVRLEPYGTVRGRVLEADGVTPALNVDVRLFQALGLGRTTAVAGPGPGPGPGPGEFEFAFVPLGSYKISARKSAAFEQENGGLGTAVLSTPDQVVDATVTLNGIGDVVVTVVDAGGTPVPSASVKVTGRTTFGGAFVGATIADGTATVRGLPVGPGDRDGQGPGFDVTAQAGTVAGAASGTIATSGDTAQVTVVLGASGSVTGRLILPDAGQTAVPDALVTIRFLSQGVVPGTLQRATTALGEFTFEGIPLGDFSIDIFEPLTGGGRKIRGQIVVNEEVVALGNIVLDLDAPRVESADPAEGTVAVPVAQTIAVTFSEPMDPASIRFAGPGGPAFGVGVGGPATALNLALVDATGTRIAGAISLSPDGRTLSVAPAAALASETRHQLSILHGPGGPLDAGNLRPLQDPFVLSFTTADSVPPVLTSQAPSPAAERVPAEAVVRLAFNEALAPVSAAGPGATLGLARGATEPRTPVAGTVAVLFGGSVIVFTPDAPLALNETFVYTLTGATDIAGNAFDGDVTTAGVQPLTSAFSTIDTRGPAIATLVVEGTPSLRAGTPVTVLATVTEADAASIDFAVDDVPAASVGRAANATSPPFAFRFALTLPAGRSEVRISARGTDTTGNFGPVATLTIPVVADQPPSLEALVNVDALPSIGQGQAVRIGVTATDDVEVASLLFSGAGGVSFSETVAVPPGAPSVSTTLTRTIPLDAPSTGTVTFQVVAVDRGGRPSVARTLALPLRDARPPTVAFDSPVEGAMAMPGQSIQVALVATDDAALATVALASTPALAGTGSRSVGGGARTTTQVFNLALPAGIAAGTSIQLSGTAADAAGNASVVATRTLRTADIVAPTVTSLAIPGGRTRVLPGETVLVRAGATDNVRVAAVSFRTAGALVTSGTTPVAPPATPAAADFSFTVPAQAQGTLTVFARARDESANESAEVALVLDAGADATPPAVQIVRPASGTVGAGATVVLEVVATDAGGVASIIGRATGAATLDETRPFAPPLASAAATFSFLVPGSAPANSTISITAEARDPSGNTSPAGPVTLTVLAAAGASVLGRVTDSLSLAAVEGASVRVTAANGTFLATTDASGDYRVDGLALGAVAVDVTDPVTGFRGVGAGNLTDPPNTVTVNVALVSAGIVEGTVLEATPGGGPGAAVAGAAVSIDRVVAGQPAQVTTGPDGRYRFPLVRLGTFTLDVTVTATGDRGRATDEVVTSGETRTVDLPLNGLGTVVVTVRDDAQNLAGGVDVTLTSGTVFGGSRTRTTAATGPSLGTVTFASVLAGPFTISALDPVSRLVGSASGAVGVGASESVTVTLQPSGAIEGTVFAPQGQPVDGITVRLLSVSSVLLESQTSANGGRFRFESRLPGTYRLEARDGSDRLRARETGVSIAQNGDTIVRDLTLIGLGTVTGAVTNGGSGVPGASVTLRSSHPVIGGVRTATSGTGGSYQVDGVPIGTFTVTASVTGQQLLGEAAGAVSQDGETVTVDVALLSNTVTLPTNRFDASNFAFDIQGNGSVAAGSNQVYVVSGPTRGAFLLDIVVGATATRFGPSPGTIGTREDGGREIAVRQTGLAGVDVTRKLFVPREGYFIRCLETLTNPSATTPVTVTVRVTSILGGSPLIRATSSGDPTLDISDPGTADRFVTLDDATDADPAIVAGGNRPAVAFAFDGAGAAERVGAATFAPGLLTYEWRNVTIPPGGTVSYLHFGVQQTTRAAARASAERLLSLPPEALAGLSAAELAEVRNFALPLDGVSAVAPLPPLDGRVFGRVLASDGATQVLPGTVRFRSDHPLFGRTHAVTSSRSFGVIASFDDIGTSRAVPVADFTLTATHPTFPAISATQAGTFGGPFVGNVALVATAGASSFSAGFPPSRATDGNLATSWFTGTNDAANLGATPFIEATLPALATVAQVNIRGDRQFAGQTGGDPFDFFRGRVELFDDGGAVLHAVDFDLPADPAPKDIDLPVPLAAQVGVRRVRFTSLADESQRPGLSEVEAIGSIAAQPSVSSTDVIFAGTGIVRGTVRRHTGVAVASGGTVRIARAIPALSGEVDLRTVDGGYEVTGVPPGRFTLTAFVEHPQGSGGAAENQGRALVDVVGGQTTTQDIVLDPTGSVTGTVRRSSGAPAGVQVRLRAGTFTRAVTTNAASGVYLFTDVPIGVYTLEATEAAVNVTSGVEVAVVQDQTTSQDLALIGFGSVQVTVTTATGGQAPAGVQAQVFPDVGSARTGNTNASGLVTITNVSVGAFTVRVTHPSNQSLRREVTGAVQTDGQVVPVTVALPAIATVRVATVRADGQTPFGGVSVDLADALFTRSATTGAADGIASFTGVAEGAFTVTTRVPGRTAARTTVAGAVTPPDNGQTVQALVVMPALATVRVTVTGAGAGARVFIRDAFDTADRLAGTTAAGGTIDIANVLEGAFVVYARPAAGAFTFLGSAAGSVAASDDLGLVPVTIQAPVSGTVEGTVVAADGQSPVVSSGELFDGASGAALGQVATGTSGTFRFQNVGTGPQGFRVRATSLAVGVFGVVVERTGAFAVPGETITGFDLALPISVVRGRVFFADGTTPVPSPVVSAEFGVAGGGTTTRPGTSQSGGTYVVLGVPEGPFTLTAEHQASRLRASEPGTVAAVTVPVDIDLILPPSGTVSGTVRDDVGNVVPFAAVELLSSGLPAGVIRIAQASAQGVYTFTRVAVGSIAVIGATGFRAGIAHGSLATDGQSITVDVSLAALGVVAGTVVEQGSGFVAPSAGVRIENVGQPVRGFEFFQSALLTADANGSFSATAVPLGAVRVTAVLGSQAGVAEGTLGAGGPAPLDVALGTAVPFPVVQGGVDGFRYDLRGDGSIIAGGRADGGLASFGGTGGATLRIAGFAFDLRSAGSPEDADREIAIGPTIQSQLLVTRKVFVPDAGGFARYLEVIENPTPVPWPLTVEVLSTLASGASTRVIVDPSATGGRFAVTGDSLSGGSQRPAIGHVFAGAPGAGGPAIVPTATRVADADPTVSYLYEVTVAPGETAIIMHFVVQRDVAATAAAETQADALSNLTDPSALDGMSPAERSQVRNFLVP